MHLRFALAGSSIDTKVPPIRINTLGAKGGTSKLAPLPRKGQSEVARMSTIAVKIASHRPILRVNELHTGTTIITIIIRPTLPTRHTPHFTQQSVEPRRAHAVLLLHGLLPQLVRQQVVPGLGSHHASALVLTRHLTGRKRVVVAQEFTMRSGVAGGAIAGLFGVRLVVGSAGPGVGTKGHGVVGVIGRVHSETSAAITLSDSSRELQMAVVGCHDQQWW